MHSTAYDVRIVAVSSVVAPADRASIGYLFETGAVGRINAAIAGQAATVYRDLATPPNFSETVHASHVRYQTWSRVKDLLSRLDPAQPRAHLRANALAAAFSRKELVTPADAEEAFSAFEVTENQLRPA